MTKKTLIILIALAAVGILSMLVVKFGLFLPQGGVMSALNLKDSPLMIAGLVFVSSLVDSFNPCAISVLLITIAFLFNLGKSRKRIIQVGSFYVLAIFLVYVLIGLGIVQALAVFNMPHIMSKIGASIVILWAAINLIDTFYPKFPIKLKIPQAAHHRMALLMEKGSIATSFVLGVLVGLSEFPCTGGPYLFILGLLHDHASHWQGLGYLLFYNIVFILPLTVILLVASDHGLLTKVENWKKTNNRTVRLVTSVIMILLGLIILQF